MKTNSIPAQRAVPARTIATPRPPIFRRPWLWTGFLAFATIAFGRRPAQASFRFLLHGQAGLSARVQRSTDLPDWQDWQVVTLGTAFRPGRRRYLLLPRGLAVT